MPAALIGGAIAAVGAVGSAVIANKGASTAAKATTQAADTASQVQRDNYDRSAAALQPWQTSGLAANGQINALLGLGGTQRAAQQGLPTVQPNAMAQFQGGQDLGIGSGFPWNISRGPLANQYAAQQQGLVPVNGNTGIVPPAQQGQSAQQAANNAFDIYRNSTGYDFRLKQGFNAVNSGYAGAGTIKSGAAMKAINDYGQGMASGEFANYLAALGNQQQLGFGAASAQAGVGQNTANSLSDIAVNQGNNLANAALVKSQNTGSAINSLGQIGGYIIGKVH